MRRTEKVELVENALRNVYHLRMRPLTSTDIGQPTKALCGALYILGRQDYEAPTCPECSGVTGQVKQ